MYCIGLAPMAGTVTGWCVKALEREREGEKYEEKGGNGGR